MTLRAIEQDCLLGSIEVAGVDGDTPVFALPKDLDEKARNKALTSLKRVVAEFSAIGLQITAETTTELMAELENASRRHNFQWLMDQVRTIQGLSRKRNWGKGIFLCACRADKVLSSNERPTRVWESGW